ncbi:MAG: N-acetylmuramoyl-L-alanine amidase, partial [Alphaproteobacteria bacterium]|nr:N-acetylmuramoyl-L-alanine amidase [Alphaproteobacteria bacterium]
MLATPVAAPASEAAKPQASAEARGSMVQKPAAKTEGFFARLWHRVTRTMAGWYHSAVRWLGSWFESAPVAGRSAAASPPVQCPSWTPNWLYQWLCGTSPKPGRLDGGGKIVIAIDPGHGGSDPGAIAPDGWQEKQLTLAVAQRLKSLLEARGLYRVILTRVDDSRIELSERVNLAVVDGAVLFVSLHANTVDGKHRDTVRGAMVFTLTPEATDAVAAKIAASENSTDAIAGGA